MTMDDDVMGGFLTRGSPGRVPAVPAISAHRGGSENAPGGTYEAYRSALAAGADYAEFDVRQTSEGVLVAFHSERAGRGRGRLVRAVRYSRLCALAGYEVPRVTEVMRLLAGRAVAHVDLKDAGCAATVTRIGMEALGPEGILVTTGDREVLASVKRRFPAVPTGLTIARGTLRLPVKRPVLPPAGLPEWAVIHQRLARAELLGECRRRGVKTMVWTVNDDPGLARWLAAPGVDALVTDRPARALFLREQLSRRAEGRE